MIEFTTKHCSTNTVQLNIYPFPAKIYTSTDCSACDICMSECFQKKLHPAPHNSEHRSQTNLLVLHVCPYRHMNNLHT